MKVIVGINPPVGSDEIFKLIDRLIGSLKYHDKLTLAYATTHDCGTIWK